MFVWPHGIHVDRDGNVWVADSGAASAEDLTKFPGEGKQGQRRRQVQPGRKGAADARQAGHAGQSARGADRADRRRHRSRQRRRLRGREPHQRRGSQSGRPHLGVRPHRQVPAHHRQDGHGARRVPDAARARVRLAGPADRGRSPQPPRPDPDQGGQADRRVPGVRPHQRARHRPERRDLHRRFRVRPNACIPAGSAASASAASRTAR